MIEFITAAGILAVLAALAITRPLAAGRTDDAAGNRDAADAALYRDQLAELDRDLERGVISGNEAEGARAEIARRLIAAARRAEAAGVAATAPSGLTRWVAIGSLVGAPLIGALVYLGIGSPGLENRPLAERDLVAEARAARMSQAEAEARVRAEDDAGPRRPAGNGEYAALVDQLEQVVSSRPDDVEGHRLLSSALLRQQRFADAWPVLGRLVELEGGDDAPADLHAAQAEAMILAAGGYVSPEAEGALARALTLEPGLPVARYYAGHALAQIGQMAEAVSLWRRLAVDADPSAPWMPALRQILADAAAGRLPGMEQGLSPALLPAPETAPAAPPGIDPDAAAAVAAMSPEERMAFMASRTEALEQRLLTEGGGPDDWAQLVRAYNTLGRAEDARRAYALSQENLSGAEAGFVREQALVLGVIDE